MRLTRGSLISACVGWSLVGDRHCDLIRPDEPAHPIPGMPGEPQACNLSARRDAAKGTPEHLPVLAATHTEESPINDRPRRKKEALGSAPIPCSSQIERLLRASLVSPPTIITAPIGLSPLSFKLLPGRAFWSIFVSEPHSLFLRVPRLDPIGVSFFCIILFDQLTQAPRLHDSRARPQRAPAKSLAQCSGGVDRTVVEPRMGSLWAMAPRPDSIHKM